MKRVIILVCIILMTAASAFIVGCGGGGSSNEKAEVKKVAEKYMKASTEFDIDGIVETITEKDKKGIDVETARQQAEEMKKTGNMDLGIKYKTGEIKIDGNNAVVEVSVEVEGKKQKANMYLTKEDGEWKVNVTKTNEASNSSQENGE